MAPSSTDLLARAKQGSDAALNLLYEQCAARLLAFIRLRLGRDLRTKLESTDILQATMLKSLAHLHEFPDYYTRLNRMEEEAKRDLGRG